MSDASQKPLLRRREFLAFGSALAISSWIPEWAAAAPAAVTRPMSVGFVEGMENQAFDVKRLPGRILFPGSPKNQADGGGGLRIVPADRLWMGDTSLMGKPLRMRIHGLYPPVAKLVERRRQLPAAVDLEVLFPSEDPLFPEPLRFQAWSFRQQHGWSPSPPVSFRFPLDWQVLPELVLTVRPADGRPATTFTTRFTLDDEPGRPRLQRGIYLLGLSADAWKSSRSLPELGRAASASTFSVLIGIESDPEPEPVEE